MTSIIKQIHSEFSEAEERLVNELDLYKQSLSKYDPNKLSRLAELGFTASKEVRMMSPEKQKEAERLRHYIAHYRMYYPQNKFITEEKVIEICKKFGLIHAPVSCYIGSIPDMNMEEILRFKVSPSDSSTKGVEELDIIWVTNDGRQMKVSQMTTDHLLNAIRLLIKRTNDTGSRGYYRGSQHYMAHMFLQLILRKVFLAETLKNIDLIHNQVVIASLLYPDQARGLSMIELDSAEQAAKLYNKFYNSQPELTIVATKDMLNLEGYVVSSDLRAEIEAQEEPPMDFNWLYDDDPIVLCKVKGGYLIVTAWGDEAAEEDVINPSKN